MKITLTIAIAIISFAFVKPKSFIPPGTVQINDSLYADETEITNFGWQEFEFWTITTYGKNSKQHVAVLPDTTVWRQSLSFNEPYVVHYYRHVAYREYPVVGISYEQAKAYCAWRTARVKSFLAIKKDFKNQNFTYRLPTKVEWEIMASWSSNFLSNNGKDEKGNRKLNTRFIQTNPVVKDKFVGNDVTVPVKSYQKNNLGLYNVLGNVAEMVEEKGICKGGAWRNNIEDVRVGKHIDYTTPTAWLGFRCVCVKNKL